MFDLRCLMFVELPACEIMALQDNYARSGGCTVLNVGCEYERV